MRVSSAGSNINSWFGPYTLDVGCTSTSVSYSDNPSFTTSVPITVGGSVSGVYTFMTPTSSRTWCTIVSNQIVNPNGTPWTGSS